MPATMPTTTAAICDAVNGPPSVICDCVDGPSDLTVVSRCVVKLDSVDCTGGSRVVVWRTDVDSGVVEECVEATMHVTANIISHAALLTYL